MSLSPFTHRRTGLTLVAAASLALSGCQTARTQRPSLNRWDRTRLEATLQAVEQRIVAGQFDSARRSLAPYDGIIDVHLGLTRARIEVEDGQYAVALQHLDAIAEQADASAAYHHLRGVALEGLGQDAEAASAYERAYAIAPTAERLVARVELLASTGQSESAAALLERERTRFPGEPTLNVLAARLALPASTETAVRELRTASLVAPDARDLRERLASTCMAAGRFEDAIPLWESLIAQSSDNRERHALRGRLANCQMRAGRYRAAQQTYQAMVLTQPLDDDARLGLAAAGLAAGMPNEALQAALQVMHRKPDDAEARRIAALCYIRLRQTARAVELLSDTDRDASTDKLLERLRTPRP